jgi:hypothetical protein
MSQESPDQPKSESQPAAAKESPWWRSKALWIGVLANFLFWIILNVKDVAFWILQIASLGNHAILTRLENSVYTRAAVGLHEFASSLTLAIVVGLFTGLCLVISLVIMRSFHPRVRTAVRLLARADPKTLAGRIVGYSTAAVAFLGGAWFMTENAISAQATLSVAHYQQMMMITRPYLTADQAMRLRSRFAQMETRDEYMKIDSELYQIAKDHNLHAPEFKPF